jgi:hypothetical protein
MPPEEAGYTYAVEPTATHRLLANEEESIYGRSNTKMPVSSAHISPVKCPETGVKRTFAVNASGRSMTDPLAPVLKPV